MHNFKKLRVWQLAMEFSADVDGVTRKFPRGSGSLADQTRRAAQSIYAQIAEGCGKDTRAETLRYLSIAMASATEVEAHLLKADRQKLIPTADFAPLMDRLDAIQKMTFRLSQNLPL